MAVVKYINARVLDKNGERRLTVYTDGPLISCVAAQDPGLPCDAVTDVRDNLLMPAFIDLHCHLRDPGYTQKEDVQSGMRAALAGGYSTLCAMANTLPVCSTPELVLANHDKAKKLRLCRLYQAAAAGEGLDDKTPTDWEALSKVTPMITNDGKTIFSDEFMAELLKASQKYGFIISTHCQPERATVERDIDLLRDCGGRLHVGHISTAQTVEMIRRAKAEGLSLTCEVTPHHLFGWDCDYKVNPPLRSRADVEALIEGIRDGTIDCLSTDHAPHTAQDKQNGMAGISNIEYAAKVFIKVFYDNGIPLRRLSEMAAYKPAELLDLSAGLIETGRLADLVILDENAQGVIRSDAMLSRSHNTPFDGRAVRGKVRKTIVEGETRYDNGQTV